MRSLTCQVKAPTAAGYDFTGTLARLCVAPAGIPQTICDAVPSGRVPARYTWYIGSANVFDSLYFVGSKIHNSWALVTGDGIIILDTLFTYNSEEKIVGGLKKPGHKLRADLVERRHWPA
jgi:metallo-beta-lactamase class B